MKQVLTTARAGFRLLSRPGRNSLVVHGVVLVVLTGLDGLGLVLVSSVVSGVSLEEGRTDVSGSTGVIIAVIVLFIARSLLSTLVSWRTITRLAREEVLLGQHNFTAVAGEEWERQLKSNPNDWFNAIDRGPSAMVQGLLVNLVTLAAEMVSGLMIFGALLFLQPLTAVIAGLYFVSAALLQHRLLAGGATKSGQDSATYLTRIYEMVNQIHALRKLLLVHGSSSLESTLEHERTELATARARVAFLALVPRYFMELTLAVGLGLITYVTYLVSGADAALQAVAVFSVAGFRLLPIVNRLQALILQILAVHPMALLSFMSTDSRRTADGLPGDGPAISMSDVCFSYEGSTENAIDHVSVDFHRGKLYAIVGPSGAGKTTLVDLCLGLLTPGAGIVSIPSGSRLAYVPQDTAVADISIGGNVALEWDASLISTEQLEVVLRDTQLVDLTGDRGLDETVTFSTLSGGQRQRIGLARALYRSPDILILDEVTSALDANTERAVMEVIEGLRTKCAVIVVAHRLTTVQNADEVIYLDRGKVLGRGGFVELQQSLPEFRRLVELGQLELAD